VITFAAGFSGLMPMATDIYLVMMPAIARDFSASLAATHASMAMFALGFGVAHLFVGILADRFGRRPVAIGGAIAFILVTLAVVRAPSLEILTLYRFIQGLVIATCPILARAIVRDTVPPEHAAKVYAQIHAITACAPLTAPFIGAAAANWGGWRTGMALLLVYGILLAAAAILFLPETRPAGAAAHPALSPFSAARQILTHPRFIFGATVTFLLYAALFTWLSTSPFLMIDQLGFTSTDVAIVLGLGSLGYMAGSLGSARLAADYAPERLIAVGAPLMLAGAIGSLIALTRTTPTSISTLALILPFYLGLGFTHANALQIVMRPFPHMAGQASAWLGLMQQLGGVIVSVLAVRGGAGINAVLVVIGCCAALTAVAIAGARGSR
jgi:MFS transporter, DHA1 family, multidrug resistance protein